MKELDCVEVIVEKDKYARDGIHKGMHGWICDPRNIDGYWLVNFPQCGEKPDIATSEIKEEDLKLITVMYAKVNEQIKAQFENAEKKTGNSGDGIFKDFGDMKVIPKMDAKRNEQIKEQFENAEKKFGNISNGLLKDCEDISDYIV